MDDKKSNAPNSTKAVHQTKAQKDAADQDAKDKGLYDAWVKATDVKDGDEEYLFVLFQMRQYIPLLWSGMTAGTSDLSMMPPKCVGYIMDKIGKGEKVDEDGSILGLYAPALRELIMCDDKTKVRMLYFALFYVA